MMSKPMYSRRTVHRLIVPAMLLALLSAACSDTKPVETVVLPSTTGQVTTAPPTTSDPNETIVLGSGSIPDTMPSEFPVPAEAVVGSTLIDRNRNLTEVVMRVPAGVEAAAGFFTTNLPNRGYTVDSSTGDASRWDIALSGGGITGTIVVTLGSQDVSQVVVRVTADA